MYYPGVLDVEFTEDGGFIFHRKILLLLNNKVFEYSLYLEVTKVAFLTEGGITQKWE